MLTACIQWCIAKNGGGYTQTGVAKGLKVPCLFMITEVSIRCQKNPGGWYTPYTRVYPPPIHHCMYGIPTEPNEIYRIIVNLKNNKSPGADNIGSKILKEVVDDITYPLSHIFNLSFVTGVVPHSLKLAKVIPVYKKGDVPRGESQRSGTTGLPAASTRGRPGRGRRLDQPLCGLRVCPQLSILRGSKCPGGCWRSIQVNVCTGTEIPCSSCTLFMGLRAFPAPLKLRPYGAIQICLLLLLLEGNLRTVAQLRQSPVKSARTRDWYEKVNTQSRLKTASVWHEHIEVFLMRENEYCHWFLWFNKFYILTQRSKIVTFLVGVQCYTGISYNFF